jgi:phenylalanyl-tRNA synthetase alpha subunit
VFGFGIERVASGKSEIADIGRFGEDDLRFLRQF